MSIFLTGATGYLGSYVTARLIEGGETVTALVRATDADAARGRLWHSLQLHFTADELADHLAEGRLRFVLGDITVPRLGLDEESHERLATSHHTLVHIAASLNRRSAKRCFDVNLRGGLAVLQLARRMHDAGNLRLYAHVSTAAVAGKLQGRAVDEEQGLEWGRSDWDPYARTKKFGEHLVSEVLGDAPTVIFRPSIILGDSRFPETTQFDMVRAFVALASLPVLPFSGEARLDIVPVDFVANAISSVVRTGAPKHAVYNLTAGTSSPTFREISEVMARELGRRLPVFLPAIGSSCALGVKLVSRLRVPALAPVSHGAALMDVFWPYLKWDVVFKNDRIVAETGHRPAHFTDFCGGLFRFARTGGFTYPYRPLPELLANSPHGPWVPRLARSGGN
jgi:thioester reductase-like protein